MVKALVTWVVVAAGWCGIGCGVEVVTAAEVAVGAKVEMGWRGSGWSWCGGRDGGCSGDSVVGEAREGRWLSGSDRSED
nr:hypothetical protein [Tanacetum cinerariifolium]